MAPTFVKAYTSVQGDGGNVGLAVTTDTDPTTDDYLVVCLCVNANADTLTPPAGGWAEATVGDNSIATGGGQIRAWYLKNPADSTTYTWTVGTSTRRSIIGLLIRGADGTTFVNVKGSLQSVPGANHTPPSLTTTADGCLVIDFIGLRQFSPDTADFTPPASGLTWTERADIQGADGNNNIRLAAATAPAPTAGALSTATWTSADVFEETIIIRIAVNAAAGGATDLVVQDATQAQSTDAVTLTQVHTLVVADATQAQSTDAVTLTQAHALAVADAAQAQTTDGVALMQVHQLVVADAAQAQATDTVTLTQTHLLTVADASHAQAVDSVTLSTAAALVVADALHAQAVDAIALTQVHTLVVQDARHAQSADTVVFAGDDPEPGVLVASGTAPILTAAGAPASTLTAGGIAATLTASGTP